MAYYLVSKSDKRNEADLGIYDSKQGVCNIKTYKEIKRFIENGGQVRGFRIDCNGNLRYDLRYLDKNKGISDILPTFNSSGQIVRNAFIKVVVGYDIDKDEIILFNSDGALSRISGNINLSKQDDIIRARDINSGHVKKDRSNTIAAWCKQNGERGEQIKEEFDDVLNELGIDEITKGSADKIYWICKNGHSYKMSPYNRLSKSIQRCSGTGFYIKF